ncbi:hypothetical protein K440DRAFT_12614 [Wilcoxina mikolae CBS 423.85]|nr:hypothetical protein K440DRAFT_12614 [Wilcoxina mikolae CBS 423.85]
MYHGLIRPPKLLLVFWLASHVLASLRASPPLCTRKPQQNPLYEGDQSAIFRPLLQTRTKHLPTNYLTFTFFINARSISETSS